VDAHFHAWTLARGDYGWLTPALAPIHRDVGVGDWRREAEACGVSAGILVQAAPTEAETRFLLGLAERHPQVLGVVGWVDALAPDAAHRVHALAHDAPRLVGLRPMLQDLPDPDWILQPAVDPFLRAMAEVGLVFDALIKPVHLPRMLQLVERHPALRIVIDHGAKPDIAGHLATAGATSEGGSAPGAWHPWADAMTELARSTDVCCKFSGLWTEAGPGASAETLRPWAQHLLASFGPQRVLWGSDWPVLELAGRYGAWWRETQATLEAAGLAAQERAAVMGGNARRVYGTA
jgi:L-fuconolactonase